MMRTWLVSEAPLPDGIGNLGVYALALLFGYLIGGIPFGYLIARWRGVDIFRQGSGNIGATNIGRVLGRSYGILVFLLDFAKGALPVAVAQQVAKSAGAAPHLLGVIVGMAAFVGHLFPVYLRFRGGKGVATGAGVVTVLAPLPTLGALIVWLAVVCATQYVSVASLAAALALCLLRLGLTPAPWDEQNAIVTSACLLAAVLVFVRHRANIRRLLHSNENRLKDTSTMQGLAKTIHVLAVGLWFGSAVFFSFVVALTLFGTFEAIASAPRAERPLWFPLPAEFDQDLQARQEQGIRAAGAAIGPMFAWYFLIQGACGLVAAATALRWPRLEPGVRVHRLRVLVLLAALVTVVVGWPLERKVSALRTARHEAGDALLAQTAGKALANSPAMQKGGDEVMTRAQAARTEFGRWHFYSLMLNFVTVLLVTIAMALTARLPVTAARMEQPVPSSLKT
jgi:acyl-phosphate glycerol 3-phosphate acyltransferase